MNTSKLKAHKKSLRSSKRKPTHPGEILREDILSELNITQGDLADRL